MQNCPRAGFGAARAVPNWSVRAPERAAAEQNETERYVGLSRQDGAAGSGGAPGYGAGRRSGARIGGHVSRVGLSGALDAQGGRGRAGAATAGAQWRKSPARRLGPRWAPNRAGDAGHPGAGGASERGDLQARGGPAEAAAFAGREGPAAAQTRGAGAAGVGRVLRQLGRAEP